MSRYFTKEFAFQTDSFEIILSESRVDRRLAELAALAEGWHFGEGVQFRQDILDRTRQLLKLLRNGWVTDLNVYPCVNGDVHLIAKSNELRLELFIREDGKTDLCEETDGIETVDIADVGFAEVLEQLETWIEATKREREKQDKEKEDSWSSSESLVRSMTINRMKDDFRVVSSPYSMAAFLWLASRASKRGERLSVTTSGNTTPTLSASVT